MAQMFSVTGLCVVNMYPLYFSPILKSSGGKVEYELVMNSYSVNMSIPSVLSRLCSK